MRRTELCRSGLSWPPACLGIIAAFRFTRCCLLLASERHEIATDGSLVIDHGKLQLDSEAVLFHWRGLIGSRISGWIVIPTTVPVKLRRRFNLRRDTQFVPRVCLSVCGPSGSGPSCSFLESVESPLLEQRAPTPPPAGVFGINSISPCLGDGFPTAAMFGCELW